MCFCTDITGLMTKIGVVYNPDEWRLFMDASKFSLKTVLLHNGNTFPSVPVFHSVGLRETHDNMSVIVRVIKYQEHGWKICSDLKVIGLLLGLQSGFTKYCCFLCIWDSRAKEKHYVVQHWEKREEFVPEVCNVKAEPLVPPHKILLPPLHIKLGLKNFVKALNKVGDAFTYLKNIFP